MTHRRMRREKKTLGAMVRMYCRARHGRRAGLCPSCGDFLAYALARLERCPFGEKKPTCAHCVIHCYKPDRRKQAKEVMRCAGPRMICRHPVLALFHMLDGLRSPPRSGGSGSGGAARRLAGNGTEM